MPISRKTCHRSEIDCSNSAKTNEMCICKQTWINARYVILNKKGRMVPLTEGSVIKYYMFVRAYK